MFKSPSESASDERRVLPGRTVAAPVRVTGRGLHSGTPATVELRPRSTPGVCFLVGGHSIPAGIDGAQAPGGMTRLGGRAGTVDTPEHLLAAVLGLGITHLDVVLEGNELPALDGSARPWVDRLDDVVSTGPVPARGVHEPVQIEAFGGIARAWPSERLEIAVDVDFGPAAKGRFALDVTPQSFVDELAWARTFLPHASLDAVLASGRGQGVEPGSVVLLGPRGPVVPVRGPDECVRHKALDLLGDLALAGVPLRGRFEVVRGTHALHHALVRAITGPARPRPRSG
jgi:UDP-3-O-[3-hydroxymyristoyl] N-acetylglucosamine deacetylase